MSSRSYSRYAFANRKRYPSFRKSSSRSFKRPNNNGYRAIPYYASSRPNALYSTVTPQSMKVCLKYSSNYTMTTTAGLSGDQKFRLNSLFDSDYSGGGHQPRGHDQWSFLYERYRVDACKVQVICGSSSAGGYISVYGNKSVSTITDASECWESQNSSTKPVQVGATTVLNKYFSLPALAGDKKFEYEADDLNHALMTSDPQNQWIGHVVFAPSDIAISGVLNFTVILTYWATLSQPVALAQS